MLEFEYNPGWEQTFLWVVYVGFAVAFCLSFGMGANDCANSYGCVYGAKVLSLWQIYALATIFETLGAGLLGYRVTETMRKSIVDVDIYNVYSRLNSSNGKYQLIHQCPSNISEAQNNTCTTYTSGEFLLGELGALTGTALWLIFATLFQMPVSTTHSSVGGTIGFSLVLRGSGGINWKMIANIVSSWVTSPLLAGLFGSLFYLIIKFSVLKRKNSFEAALHILPAFFWFAIFVNMFAVFFRGSKYLHFENINWWQGALLSCATGGSVAGFLWLYGIHKIRARATLRPYLHGTVNSVQSYCEDKEEPKNHSVSFTSLPSGKEEGVEIGLQTKNNSIKSKLKSLLIPAEEDPKTVKVFHFLQILSACFLSFSHGSNDTANAVGPLVGLWLTYKYGLASVDASSDPTLEYLILFGAGSMIIGLWCLGHKVIKTIGKQITTVSAPSGFCMELATAFTVILGSRLGIPLSTTHCMVGAVVIVGYVRTPKNGIAWRVFGNIVVAWVVTLPVTMGVAGLVTYLLAHFYYGSM